MQANRILSTLSLCGLLLAAAAIDGRAQTTANWIGPASGGEWNTAANWDTGLPPGLDANGTTNAIIGPGTNVSYSLPMAASLFGSLANKGVVSILTNGFNPSGISMINPAGTGKLFVGTNGVVNVTGNLAFCSNSVVILSNGAAANISGSLLIGCGSSGGTGSATAGSYGILTNNGATLNATVTSLNIANGSVSAGCLLLINGGTNNLGTTTVKRSAAGSSGFSTFGTEGLVINGGVVTTTNLNVGGGNGNSFLSTIITGGSVTNFGGVFINQGSQARASRVLQTGGLFVVPDPGVVNPNPTATTNSIQIYAITGGTNIVGGFYLGNTNEVAGTGANPVPLVNLTNAASIYVGSQGIASNGIVWLNLQLNNGGLFGATAPWTGSTTMKIASGTFTFQTADLNNNPNNITLSGVLAGTGNLNVTGAGTLTLSASNTFSGNTAILGGTLALGAGGSLASPKIVVGSGTLFDVSGTGGYSLNGSQTLSGFGTVNGAVSAASTATIYPGSNSVTGTLTFAGGLTENGGVNNEFNLSGNPSGTGNDFINAPGGLTLTGTNTITIIGSLSSSGAYPLFYYGGSLSGDVTNFTVTGATGTLYKDTTAKIIYFTAQTSVRAATNVTWLGNATANNWDTESTTNWLNKGTGLLDFFVPNDNVLFSNLGASNSVINLSATVIPGSITVNTTSNYTFTGVGAVGGTGSLTISNGSLTLLTTNTYTGPTILAGGVLATPFIANSFNASGIGAASTDPENVIFNGGTLSYYGDSVGTDHGITFTNLGGTVDVTNGTTLTLNGLLAGNGGLTLIDSGTLVLSDGNTYSGGTTISNGILSLTSAIGAGTGPIILAGGTLKLATGSQPTYANDVTVVTNSTLNSAGGNNNIISGGWTGNSNVTVTIGMSSSGTFSVNGGMTNFQGTIELGDGTGFFRFNGGGGNTQFGATNATIDLGTSTATLEARNPGTMGVGALEGGSGTFVKGPSSTAGTLIWAIGSSTNNPNTTYYGTIENAAANEISAVTKIGAGTLSLAGQNTYTGTTTISSGTLALTNNPTSGSDGSIDSSATINLVSGAVLDVSGRSDATFQVGGSVTQLLEGRGTIYGSLNINGAGIIAPGGGQGGSTGILTATNAITLNGTTWMKLNRTNSPTSDRIVSSLSTITYGGTLVITNIGPAPQVGDTFTLFSAASLSAGSFGTLVLPNYYNFDLSQLTVNGTITLTNAFRPAISSVDYSSLAGSGTITLTATNGAANGNVYILTSTNIALPLSGWTTNVTTTFDGDGTLSSSITVDQTLPELYIELLVQ